MLALQYGILLPHQAPAVRPALLLNGWPVYHQAASPATSCPPSLDRINNVRTRRGQLQVLHLPSGHWHDVAPADTLYQF